MKHAIDIYVGRRQDGAVVYELACGKRVVFPGTAEVIENDPVDVGGDRGWCPDCFPEKVVAQLRDEDGNSVALHPELGPLQQEGDGTTVSEDLGDETVLKEEVVEE
jgi:hypothetical protein